MTLLEMSKDYAQQAERIKIRILEIKNQPVEDGEELYAYKQRLRMLEEMRQEASALATLTEHYYDRGYWKYGKYAL